MVVYYKWNLLKLQIYGLMGLSEKIESLTRKACYEQELIEGGKIGIALSGGKDSMTLMLMLKRLSGRGFPPFELVAFNVGGAFSCGPAVRNLDEICSDLGVKLVKLEVEQDLKTLACYPCSRKRRKLIFDAAKKEGVKSIAFGHHRDDHIQTLMMNLLHKGEFKGNLAKVPLHRFGITIIRPLILVSEQMIRSFAREKGFARITCQCPVGQNSVRKQVEDLIGNIEDLFPNARENLAQAGFIYGSKKALDLE